MEWMFLPLKRYAEFTGRSRRQEYWMFVLGVFLLWVVLFAVAAAIGISAMGFMTGGGNAVAGGMVGMFASMGILAVVFLIVWLGLLIPSLAVAVRRLHDTDRSGWWLFLYIGPYILSTVLRIMAINSFSSGLAAIAAVVGIVGFIGAIVLIVFMCLPGTPGPNRYGPDPLGGAANLAETFG